MPHQFPSFPHALRAVPVTFALIGLSLLGFALFQLDRLDAIAALSYRDYRYLPGPLDGSGEFWRLLTPIFLHFSWLHIAFNSLWVWELGGLIEQRLGSRALALLVLLSAVASNTAQFVYGGSAYFGGMSGVVYALLGFCAVFHHLRPGRGLFVPRAVLALMVGWLLFCMVVPAQAFGFGGFANAAHVGGLVIGAILGLAAARL